MHPELVTLIHDHIKEFGIGPDGRIFRLPRGGIVTDRAYLAVFHQARAVAFTEAESASLLPPATATASAIAGDSFYLAPYQDRSDTGTVSTLARGSTVDLRVYLP